MKIISLILREKQWHKQCIIYFDNTKIIVKSLKQDNLNFMNPKSFTYISKDGLTLFGRGWVASTDKPQGIVYLIHSLREHSGRYDYVGNKLAQGCVRPQQSFFSFKAGSSQKRPYSLGK